VKDAVSEKNKVINLQGQGRKVVASRRLTSLETCRSPTEVAGGVRTLPWFKPSAKIVGLGPGIMTKGASQSL